MPIGRARHGGRRRRSVAMFGTAEGDDLSVAGLSSCFWLSVSAAPSGSGGPRLFGVTTSSTRRRLRAVRRLQRGWHIGSGMEGQTEGRHEAGEVSVEMGACRPAKGSVNEDAYLVDVGHLLFGVFDFLGATTQGGEAAGLAAEAIRSADDEHGDSGDCEGERAFLLRTVRAAGELILATLEDGFTTASVVRVCRVVGGRAMALICNVGDSRVYRFTAAGMLEKCTLDCPVPVVLQVRSPGAACAQTADDIRNDSRT